jgi:DMSO/TMAO reductase YedYZ molybdopterin-dependent catalytic subunit
VSELNRRELLAGLASLLVFQGSEGEELVPFTDLANFKAENHAALPRVKFFDLRRLTSWRTPADEFFVFHQTNTPIVDAAQWRLRIDGFVERPKTLTLAEIQQRPDKRDLGVTIECSGNTPRIAANGQVSNGMWSGVGLASLLKECGVKPEAREVAFFGIDLEKERADGPDVPHGRSIYIQDALDPNVMLAYALNGAPLPPDHGFPLRLIVPGWYGMTQIKWLTRIEVLDRRYEGAHMARNYHTLRDDGMLVETSISKNHLKSVVARATRRKDASGKYAYRIAGAAWGGPLPLKSLEVRVDSGPWRPATLGERHGDYAWTLWSLDWSDATPGPHSLVSRAVDTEGNVQPTEAEWQKDIRTVRENNSQWVRSITIPA